LKYTEKNDKIKSKYCESNNIQLIRIKYDIKFERIKEILENLE